MEPFFLSIDGEPIMIPVRYRTLRMEDAMDSGMGTPVRQGENTLRESEELKKMLEELNATIDVLEGKLQPIMSPTTSVQSEDQRQPETPVSPVLDNVRDSKKKVKHIMRRIHGLIEKIEL